MLMWFDYFFHLLVEPEGWHNRLFIFSCFTSASLCPSSPSPPVRFYCCIKFPHLLVPLLPGESKRGEHPLVFLWFSSMNMLLKATLTGNQSKLCHLPSHCAVKLLAKSSIKWCEWDLNHPSKQFNEAVTGRKRNMLTREKLEKYSLGKAHWPAWRRWWNLLKCHRSVTLMVFSTKHKWCWFVSVDVKTHRTLITATVLGVLIKSEFILWGPWMCRSRSSVCSAKV